MKFHTIAMGGLSLLLLAISPATASAHVSVKPTQVAVGTFQTFTTGVPNERDQPTTQVRLLIPEDVEHVSPNVKPGWTVKKSTSGEGDEAKVTELIWSGGSIPAGQRDEFLFSAKVPAEEITMKWMAYQTYQDGTVVAWDRQPGGDSHAQEQSPNTGPYSETKVLDDLNPPVATSNQVELDGLTQLQLMTGPVALLLSGVALYLIWRRKSDASL
jgi:uncharacterized protein YcnI